MGTSGSNHSSRTNHQGEVGGVEKTVSAELGQLHHICPEEALKLGGVGRIRNGEEQFTERSFVQVIDNRVILDTLDRQTRR